MTFIGWLQIALVLGAVLVCAWPLGLYMARVFQGEKTLLSPVLRPVERVFYGAAGIKAEQGAVLARLHAGDARLQRASASCCSTR